MNEEYLLILAHEFRAGKDSFLLQLRCNNHWDKEAFHRLTEAMRRCCKHYQYSREQLDQELEEQKLLTDEQLDDERFADEYFLRKEDTLLPRWLAFGYYYLATFVKDYTSHPAWEKTIVREPEYYRKAYERLEHLADWFFYGQSPWIDEEKGWARLHLN